MRIINESKESEEMNKVQFTLLLWLKTFDFSFELFPLDLHDTEINGIAPAIEYFSYLFVLVVSVSLAAN